MSQTPGRRRRGRGWLPLWLLLWPLPLLLALPPLQATPPGLLLQGLDSQLAALALRLRGPRPARGDVLVLAIDADSLALPDLLAAEERLTSPLLRSMGPWPWPRALQAELAAWVLERGARQVVFNIVHSQPSRFGPADDEAFVQRLARWHRQLVLPAAYTRIEQDGIERSRLSLPRSYDRWPVQRRPALGLTTLLQSSQGLSEALPGRDWLQENLQGFATHRPLPLAFAATGLTPPQANLAIDLPGPAGTIPHIPAWTLPQQPAQIWRGRIVVIGVTAADAGDQQETAFGPMSGTDLEAAALTTVLERSGRLPLSPPWLIVLLTGWGLLGWTLLRRGDSSRRSLTVALALATAALLLAGGAWALAGRLLPASALLLAPLLAGGVRAAGLGLREQQERAYLYQLLARRISPTLLQDILREPGPFWTQVGGSRCRCVVLFTDLVGFTDLSARLEPGPLFALLNRYFEAIASAVIEQQGLVDKFIGDSLMAEFGLPRSRGERQDALAAVTAAVTMQRRLEELNRSLAEQGLPQLRQGIGLHLGEVIAGNLGSSQRLEFTVVGATVNLAARLEGLTRRFPEHPILISGELKALLPPDWPVVDLGEQTVKGWPEPIRVFALQDSDRDAAAPSGPPDTAAAAGA